MTWREITCAERETLVDTAGRSYNGFSDESGVGVLGSRTDLDGFFGEPAVFTEWGFRDDETPLLRDERWPNSDRPCEHHVHADGVARVSSSRVGEA